MKRTTGSLSDTLYTEGLLAAPVGAGAYLKDFFNRQQINAATAARTLGVAASTLTRLFNGESELSVDLATKLAQHFAVPVELLFKLDAQYKSWQVQQRLDVA